MHHDTIQNHFASIDPMLHSLAIAHGIIPLPNGGDPFDDLCNAIVCQQLSDKAGTAIWKKFTTLFPHGDRTPQMILEKSIDELRISGISQPKAHYIQNIAHAFCEGLIQPEVFPNMDDEMIIQKLVTIKGVGRWTAEMFLIFSLGRPDVFSCGDLGLRKGVQKLYGLKHLPEEKQLLRLTKKWSPYRSYASLLLWKSLD